MKVFLCWSGEASHHIANALHEWLADTIQELKPFMSSRDIRKGDRWRHEIGSQLAETHFGVLCLTPTNLAAPWILFEAGAISKNELSRVTAALYKTSASALTGPLSQFQHTSLEKGDLRRLLAEINEMLDSHKRLSEVKLERAFERNWPALEEALRTVPKEGSAPATPNRSLEDMVSELLDLVRAQGRQIQQSSERPKGILAGLAALQDSSGSDPHAERDMSAADESMLRATELLAKTDERYLALARKMRRFGPGAISEADFPSRLPSGGGADQPKKS